MIKKLLMHFICILAALSAGSVFAADENSNNLQQQLQDLQQSLGPAQQSAAQNTTTLPPPTTTTTTTTTTPSNTPAMVSNNVEAPSQPNMEYVPNTMATIPSNKKLMQLDESTDDLRDQAFLNVTNSVLPLSPSQIQILRNLYDATQRAAAAAPGVPPRPTSTIVPVDLRPGSTPPVIRLGAGFVTSMVFIDSTGAPWPIDSYSLGNPGAFNIQWDKKSNILLIQAIAAHRVGNLAVLLKGLNTPVMIELTPGQSALDMRVDLRVPGLGPQAKPTFSGLPGTESPDLLSLLDGIPPPGAKALKASDCENCVWLLNGKLYLRTQFTVLSPGWISTLSSADGTHVYEMQPTPLVLATYNGKTIKLKIDGF